MSIRFSIETTYDDSNNDVNNTVVVQSFTMGDLVTNLDAYTALEAFMAISESLDIEERLLTRAIRESERECELQRDTSKCIAVTSRKFEEDKDGNNQCSICVTKFAAEQDLVTLPCEHTFHKQCIEEWGHYKAECPLCKKSIPLVKENLADDKDGMEQTNTAME